MRSFVEELAAVLSDGTKREKLRLPSDNPLGRAGLSLKLPRLGVDRCLHGTIARGSPVFPPHEGEPVAEKVLRSKVPSLSSFWGVWGFLSCSTNLGVCTAENHSSRSPRCRVALALPLQGPCQSTFSCVCVEMCELSPVAVVRIMGKRRIKPNAEDWSEVSGRTAPASSATLQPAESFIRRSSWKSSLPWNSSVR